MDKKKYIKEYRLKNKEKIRQQEKEYKLKNKEKIKQYKKEYYQTENGKKLNLIKRWKQRGLKVYGYTYDELYEYYLSVNICQVCEVTLNTNTKTKKCMDHCHITGCFRWVLCQSCNANDCWITKYPLSIYKII